MDKQNEKESKAEISGRGITEGISKSVGKLKVAKSKSGFGQFEDKAQARRKTFLIVGIVVALLAIAFAVGIKSDAPKKALDSAANKASIAVNGPCSGDKQLIADYNQETAKNGVTNLQDISKIIQSKPGYEDDPTCTYILAVAIVSRSAKADLGTTYAQYEKAVKDGKSISKDLNDGINRQEHFKLMELLIEESKTESESSGQG